MLLLDIGLPCHNHFFQVSEDPPETVVQDLIEFVRSNGGDGVVSFLLRLCVACWGIGDLQKKASDLITF